MEVYSPTCGASSYGLKISLLSQVIPIGPWPHSQVNYIVLISVGVPALINSGQSGNKANDSLL